ncbi:PspC domain-containing protein [Desnuesiella massiliensis]|uniref:PspC domain-containing protein n=1 Tax=Desnuesiella massiliensis TaxID=1650662 RepID=UPI000939BEFF
MSAKRLYKIKEQAMVSGVCAGIAEYLQVDVSIIRLVWLGFTFLGGSGILAYIAAVIILPEKRDVYRQDPNYGRPYQDAEFYHENPKDKDQ